MNRIVLCGVGSPLVVDAEEACARAGIEIVAGVRNVDAPVWVSGEVRVVDGDGLDDELRRHPVVIACSRPAIAAGPSRLRSRTALRRPRR